MKCIEVLEVDNKSGLILNRFHQTLEVAPGCNAEERLKNVVPYLLGLMRKNKDSVVQFSWTEFNPPKQTNFVKGIF